MQKLTVIFNFSVFDRKIDFGQIWSKNPKLLVGSEIWFLDKFEFAEFNWGIHYFVLDQKKPFLANLLQKIKIVTLS